MPQLWRSCLLWGISAPVVAFDIDAHDAIGQTAASAMDQASIRQMKRLLGGQDASEVAGWGHQVDDTFPGMSRLHFQVHDDSAQPFCGPKESRVAKCEDNVCLLSAIKHFYGKVLADEGRKTDFPAIDYAKVEKGVKFTDADSVKLLINLVGDLHQPMHVGFAGDDNGRNVQVTVRGKTMSLYDAWDKGISEIVREQESNFWLGGWTHIRAIQHEFQADKDGWKADGATKMFDKWASESVDFACTKAYKHPITGKMIAGPDKEAGPVVIDEQAYQAWRELWLRQILLAGERTAIVLNDILDSEAAKKLTEGTGVKTNADEEKEKQKAEWAKEFEANPIASQKRSFSSFNMGILMTNMCIAAVVVPCFLVVVNHGMNPKVWMAMLTSLTEGGSDSGSSNRASSGPGKRYE